jgi:hypothetical protein
MHTTWHVRVCQMKIVALCKVYFSLLVIIICEGIGIVSCYRMLSRKRHFPFGKCFTYFHSTHKTKQVDRVENPIIWNYPLVIKLSQNISQFSKLWNWIKRIIFIRDAWTLIFLSEAYNLLSLWSNFVFFRTSFF